jgi:hypothetical protein
MPDAPLNVSQIVVRVCLFLVAVIAISGGTLQFVRGQPDTAPRLDNVHRFMAGVYLSTGFIALWAGVTVREQGDARVSTGPRRAHGRHGSTCLDAQGRAPEARWRLARLSRARVAPPLHHGRSALRGQVSQGLGSATRRTPSASTRRSRSGAKPLPASPMTPGPRKFVVASSQPQRWPSRWSRLRQGSFVLNQSHTARSGPVSRGLRDS